MRVKKIFIVIGIVSLFFSIYFYLANQESSYNGIPTKLTIAVGKSSELRFILIDTKRNKKVGDVFKEATDFQELAGKLISKVKVENNKYGFIDNRGNWVFKPIFDEAKTFSKENLARVKIGNKWGFIKSDGTWLIKPKFNYVGAFNDGYAFVKEDNGYFHYINTLGKKAFEGRFFSASNFCQNGQAVVSIKKMTENHELKEFYGRVNREGKIIEPFIHLKKSNAKRGCINKNKWFTLNMYSLVRKDNHWGIYHDDDSIELFPSTIISPLNCNKLEIFMSEKSAMVDNERGIVYFDSNMTIDYRFRANKEGTMSLYDAEDKEIWRSNIEKFKMDTCEIKERTEEKRLSIISKSKNLKWIRPSDKTCISNGGSIKNSSCFSTWKEALQICNKSGGRVPKLEELEGVVLSCGGELKNDDREEKLKNMKNKSYQSCYKSKNFTSNMYWSSSYDEDFAHYIWLMNFNEGKIYGSLKKHQHAVQCIGAK